MHFACAQALLAELGNGLWYERMPSRAIARHAHPERPFGGISRWSSYTRHDCAHGATASTGSIVRIEPRHPRDQRVRRLTTRAASWELVTHGFAAFAPRPANLHRTVMDTHMFAAHPSQFGDTASRVERYQQQRVIPQAHFIADVDGREPL